MLWYKAWLESRFRLVLCLFMVVSLALAAWSVLHSPKLASKAEQSAGGAGTLVSFSIIAIGVPVSALILAGAGVNAQTNWGMTPGLHPSTQFTLSLPVSRWQLLWTRGCLGLGLLFGITLLALLVMKVLVPSISLASLPYLLLGATVFYLLQLWLISFLDEMWSGIIGLMIAGMLTGYSIAGGPGWANTLGFMTGRAASWQAVLFYLVVSALFAAAAYFNIRRKEY